LTTILVEQSFVARQNQQGDLVHAAGWSNVATAVAGAGFTGSYIFSQTIFTMRAGVNSRINGFIVSFLMLVIFVAPFSVIEYLPSYFFGSLMIWIGWEIARVGPC
jgi:SulP family sulfate permease